MAACRVLCSHGTQFNYVFAIIMTLLITVVIIIIIVIITGIIVIISVPFFLLSYIL